MSDEDKKKIAELMKRLRGRTYLYFCSILDISDKLTCALFCVFFLRFLPFAAKAGTGFEGDGCGLFVGVDCCEVVGDCPACASIYCCLKSVPLSLISRQTVSAFPPCSPWITPCAIFSKIISVFASAFRAVTISSFFAFDFSFVGFPLLKKSLNSSCIQLTMNYN